ncbi:cysteine desulfurase family protein [Mangrovivirga sp. M17]|uniref:Cysteine desulfurase family protein n=1 Tax=Mangrovivirga halotolerans TaxID=2993936 RepID=A0ABT3RPY0_9BACT|nr:cysteine desulfurase family protein [Mangrovivirga halotolerans]MCX2743849.1 cysteine desulfurase family protein [Mangrovivirga halotolerans]
MKRRNRIYLDYNATTPVDTEVLESMLPYFNEIYGNASSDHSFGWESDEAVELAREQLADLLNCNPTEIIFTSGATEAANIAIHGYCKANQSNGNHIITCKTEHKAVLDTLQNLEKQGFDLTYLDVDREGNIDIKELENSINSQTILVCLMMANNETGLIHPIEDISDVVHGKGVKLLSDITQAIGKIPVDLQEIDPDLAFFSSHKIYGPKGVGALFINKSNKLKIDPHFYGGGQEYGMRPGTLNVPGIVGFANAAEVVLTDLEEENERILSLRNKLENQLLNIDCAKLNSGASKRLPNTINISFENIEGSNLLRRLNTLALSRGSACSANTLKPSHVLKAMGLSDELALSSIRISLGRNTTIEEVEYAAEEIRKAVDELKVSAV